MATQIKRPIKVFDFAGNVPANMPPGERLDAQFQDHAQAITSTQDALKDIRRDDGKLKNHLITLDTLDPALVDQITASYRQSIEFNALSALASAQGAAQSRVDAQSAAANALVASLQAEAAALQVQGGAGTALAAVQAALTAAQSLQTALDQRATDVQNSENDAALAAATAEEWANVSFAWAEHMPGTIPPNILAAMGITGDHWSARWWANYCDQLISGVQPAVDALYDFNEHYVGDSTTPPTLDGNNNPVTAGCMYFNTTDLTMYVYNGTSWQSLTGSGGGAGTITGGENLGNAHAIFAQESFGTLQFKTLRFSAGFTVTDTATEVQAALTAVDWALVINEPTSLSGYGIADAYTKGEVDTKNTSQDNAIALKANTSYVDTGLAGKSNTGHGHAISDVSGLQTALDGKAATNHNHAFISLTDTPANYTGAAGKLAAVNGAGNAIEFITPPAGSDVNKAYVDQQDALAYPKTGGPLNGPSSAKRTSAGTVTGTYAPNFALSDDHEATIASAVTIGNPANAVAGQSGIIYISVATGAAISFASVWDWEGGTVPVPSTANGAVDAIAYHVRSPASIVAKYLKAVA